MRGCLARLIFDDGGMNLLSTAGLRAIGAAFDKIEAIASPSLRGKRSIVLTFESGRPGLFAAGADMREMVEFHFGQAEAFSRTGQELFTRISRFRALTAVVVDGDCFGGALDFMMSFDLRIATSRARFSHPGGRIGIVTGFGGTSAWRSASRPAFAGPMLLSNEVVGPERARHLGLVHEITDDAEEIHDRLMTARARLPWIAGLKRLTHTERSLSSLSLLANRLDALTRAAGDGDGGKPNNGKTRDTSRHLFG